MPQERAGRVEAAMQKEIADIIRNRLKDPRVGFVSVTEVEASPDLRQAKVFVSVYGSEEERTATIKALEGAAGFIRSELGRRVRLRYTPELVFHLDSSIERGVRVAEILNRIKREKRGEGPGATGKPDV